MKNVSLYCSFLLVVILSFVLLAGKAPAENLHTITGSVSGESGNPLEGAKVSANESETVTDSEGTFRFAGLPAGDYELTASAHGYIATTEKVYIDNEVPLGITIAISIILPECPYVSEAKISSLTASLDKVTLAKNKSTEIAITVTNDTGCPVEGVKCKRILSSSNKRYLEVKPRSAKSDENGQAGFTITAKEEKENVKVKFKTNGSKDKLTIKVTVVK